MTLPAAPRDKYARAQQALAQAMSAPDAPTLAGPGTRSVEAWFLGPKAENAEVFEDLVQKTVRDQIFWRRSFHPADPPHITEEAKRSPAYTSAIDLLRTEHERLLAHLKRSVPFFSMRYQGHMNWELTLPGLLGYLSAMMYNPNNVAFEGSTVTTLLEMLVGDDLCRMLGYTIPDAGAQKAGALRPWGHITCDGTVANIEALWSARNLKFYPVALQAALRREPALAAAKEMEVTLGSGERARLVDLDVWHVLNLDADQVLALPVRILAESNGQISPDVLQKSLLNHSLQRLGLWEFGRRFLGQGIGTPVFLVPGSRHYSFPKAAALLGLGLNSLIDVPVDRDGRMNLAELEKLLSNALQARQPVLMVAAIMGSTEESAVDPLTGVLAVRDRFRKRGLDFSVHADAAWGGYHASTIREDFELGEPFGTTGFTKSSPPLVAPLSAYARAQYHALAAADSITVDPHKSGYIPYPAGALCYRNSAMRNLVSFSAPVVFHGDTEPTVGIYGIEGSKPGAAAAAVYLSHRVIRPSKSGYGQIIGQALFSCKQLYARLLTLAGPEDRFFVTPVCRLPGERAGDAAQAARELELVRARIARRTSTELLADPEALGLFSEIGPDQNILAYAVNFTLSDGRPNADLDRMNALNQALYRRLSIPPGREVASCDLIVSTTDLDAEQYGTPFINELCRRTGATRGPKVTVLRSVVMDPWLAETTHGSFLDELEAAFRRAIADVLPAFLDGSEPRSCAKGA